MPYNSGSPTIKPSEPMPNKPTNSTSQKAEEAKINPVDLMAVERTTTALFGTAISFIVLGFVIEKFQLFLAITAVELKQTQRQHFPELLLGNFYHYLGIAIVLLGTGLAIYTYFYYNRWIALLSQRKIDTDKKVFFYLALFIALIGLLIVASMMVL